MPDSQLASWKPRSYQLTGVKLMISQACAGLLMDPGLGKTSCGYMAHTILQQKGFIKRTLVICPLRPAYRVWPHQKDKFKEFAHLRVGILHGKEKEEILADKSNDMCVINPEGLAWLFGAVSDGKKMRLDPGRVKHVMSMFDMLYVDESTKFKNPQTARFKLMRQVVKYFRRRYIFTGTPTPKGLMDLFGQVYILDEGASLGKYITHYRTEYFYQSGFGGYDWTPQPDADKRIGEKIAPLVYRVPAKGNIELPDLVLADVWVDLPKPARVIYDKMYSAMLAELEAGTVVAANAAVASSKCRQVCNGHIYDANGDAHFVHDAKLAALNDLLEELQGEPLLITYEFDFDRESMKEIPCISTGNAKRDDERIMQFSRGELPAVCGQPKSISLGIDGLQDSCCHVAMFGAPWSLLDYQQVIDRVRRSGNKSKTVVLHRILARNTIDERVLEVLDGRDRTQQDFLTLLQGLRV